LIVVIHECSVSDCRRRIALHSTSIPFVEKAAPPDFLAHTGVKKTARLTRWRFFHIAG